MEIAGDYFSMTLALKLQRVMSPSSSSSSSSSSYSSSPSTSTSSLDVSGGPLRYSEYSQMDKFNDYIDESSIYDINQIMYNNNNNSINYMNTINYNLSNYQSLDFPGNIYRHTIALTAIYCVAYIVVFIVGLIGNSFVIAVVLRSPRMRTVTNFFIVNLAIADILVIVFCLPATLMSNIYVPWMLGWLMCKIVPYIQGVSVAASVYSLCAVSLDRFLAIWWPLKLQITKGRARIMILGIWVIALGSTIPWALYFQLIPIFPDRPDIMLCIEEWPSALGGALYFLLANLMTCYVLPMVLISVCYVLIWIKVWNRSIPGDSRDAQMDRMQQKSKVKVVKMLVAVVILFVLSWLPLYIIFARIKFVTDMDSREEEILQIATPVAQWLGSSNSCINPILYAFFNKKYRRGFGAIIRSKSCCARLRYYENVAIASSSTSTRKSSHYHNKKPPYSPSIKSDAVSYIYEQNNITKKHNIISKQDSNLSTARLLKQDSNVSRQSVLLKQDSSSSRRSLIKQESLSSSVSRQDSNLSRNLLLKQDSNGSSKNILTKEDSQFACIIGGTRKDQILRQHSDLSKRNVFVKQDTTISYIEPRKGYLCKQDTQNSFIENKKNSLCRQDSVASFNENKKYQLVKQDSVVSFAEPNTEPMLKWHQLTKQDSIIQYPPYIRSGDSTHTHHVSILKKTDSQNSSPRRNIEFLD